MKITMARKTGREGKRRGNERGEGMGRCARIKETGIDRNGMGVMGGMGRARGVINGEVVSCVHRGNCRVFLRVGEVTMNSEGNRHIAFSISSLIIRFLPSLLPSHCVSNLLTI